MQSSFFLQTLKQILLKTLESLDGGKLYLVCWYNDVPFSANVLRYFAGWCDKDPGQTLPSGEEEFFFNNTEQLITYAESGRQNGRTEVHCSTVFLVQVSFCKSESASQKTAMKFSIN